MRVLVYGAGAIGGYLGALLARQGADITLLSRGATHAALAARGIHITWADGRTFHTPVRVCHPDEDAGLFELVFVALKSMQLAGAASDIARRLAPGGSLVMIQNGLPWWYFERVVSPLVGRRLQSLDPHGELARSFDLDTVVGAVIHKPVMVRAPGELFIPAVQADRLVIGEVDDRGSARLDSIAALVSAAGLPCEPTGDIRRAKWEKLLLNVVWNPLCALTQAPHGTIAAWAPAASLVRAIMAEGSAVAAAIGVVLPADAEAELCRVAGNFSQQPSMLQDVRAGRPLEWEAIIGSVVEIAEWTGVAVPTLKVVMACVGVLDQRICSSGTGIGPLPKDQGKP